MMNRTVRLNWRKIWSMNMAVPPRTIMLNLPFMYRIPRMEYMRFIKPDTREIRRLLWSRANIIRLWNFLVTALFLRSFTEQDPPMRRGQTGRQDILPQKVKMGRRFTCSASAQDFSRQKTPSMSWGNSTTIKILDP